MSNIIQNLGSEAESNTTYWRNEVEVNLKHTLLFSTKIQDNVMHMCEILVSLFRILWMTMQLLQQLDGKISLTSWHFDVCYIVRSYSNFLFSYMVALCT